MKIYQPDFMHSHADRVIKLGIFAFVFLALTIVSIVWAVAVGAAGEQRYWVGGSGNWDETSHWSETSGGPGGAALPDTQDNVFFDGNSGGGTVTVSNASSAGNLDFTGYTGLFAGTSSLAVGGSLTFAASQQQPTYSGVMSFVSPSGINTITFAGHSLTFNIVFDKGDGWGNVWWNLQSDIRTVGDRIITLNEGYLDTKGFGLSQAGGVLSFESAAKTEEEAITTERRLHLGSSELVVKNWNIKNSIIEPEESTINFTGTSDFHGGRQRYHVVNFHDVTTNPNDYVTIFDRNSFHVLRKANVGAYTGLRFAEAQTITGALDLKGNNSSTERLQILNTDPESYTTILFGPTATADLQNVDFIGIDMQPDYGVDPRSFGDPAMSITAYGSSNINATQPVDRYWVGGAGDWNDTSKWSETSGGSGGASVPLLHDKAYFTESSFSAPGQVVAINANYQRLPALITDTEGTDAGIIRTPVMANSVVYAHGGIQLSQIELEVGNENTTLALNPIEYATIHFKDGTTSLKTIILGVDIGYQEVTIEGDFTMTHPESALILQRGGLTVSPEATVSIGQFVMTGQANLMISNTVWDFNRAVAKPWDIREEGFNMYAYDTIIRFSGNAAIDRTFAGGALWYSTFEDRSTGSGRTIIAGSPTIDTLSVDPGRTVLFESGSTTGINAAFNVTGTNGSPITLGSTGAGAFELAFIPEGGLFGGDYLSISNSIASPAGKWYAGENSIDGGSNVGWSFSALPRVPDVANDLVATRGNGQVTLTWSAPNDNGAPITDYIVMYKRTSDLFTWNQLPGSVSSETGAVVTGLTNGVSYDFLVHSYNAAGSSESQTPYIVSATPATVPGSPTNVSAVRGNGSVSVSFTPPSDNGGSPVTQYTVTSSPGGITAVGSGSPITVSGLTNGTSYTFTVVAGNGVGSGVSSASSAAIVPATTPDSPTGLVAVPGNAQAVLTWSTPSNNGGLSVVDYVVEYKLRADSTWNTFTDGVSTNLTTAVTGLTNGSLYDFRVSALNDIGQGPVSTNSSTTPRTVPGTVSTVTATPANQSVSVGWAAPASNGGSAITDYIVQYKLSGNPTWLTFTDGVSTATSAVVTGLVNGSAYDFQVAAVNIAGTGSYSAEAVATPRTVPVSPTAVSAVRGNTVAIVSFTAPVDNGGSAITGYTVTSSPGGVTATGATSPITVTGLTNGVSYTFTVTATNIAGSSIASSASSNVTPATVPGVPQSPVAVPGNGQVTVSWTAPASNGGSAVTDYTIDYKLSASQSWTPFSDGVSSGTSVVVTGLSNGSSYDFRIAAVNDVGTGGNSSSTSAIPRTIPGSPSELSAVPGNSQVSLTWSAPGSDGGSPITDYSIEYKLSVSSNWLTFADSVSSATSSTVTGLSNGNSYDFRVSAVNIAGRSAAGETATASPSFVYVVISDVVAIPGDSSITVTWKTDESADSRVEYGPDDHYGSSTVVTTSGVTDHSVIVTGLEPCVTYHFRVISKTIQNGADVVSADHTTYTTGCTGDTEVVGEDSIRISSVTGGAIQLSNGNFASILVTAPAGYASQDAVIQVKRLFHLPVGAVGKPVQNIGKVDSQVYEVKAVLSDGSLMTSFDAPITFTVTYTDEEVEGLVESTLRLFNYHEGEWSALSDCVVSSQDKTITCTTDKFSLFALFGDPVSTSPVDPTLPPSIVDKETAKIIVLGNNRPPITQTPENTEQEEVVIPGSDNEAATPGQVVNEDTGKGDEKSGSVDWLVAIGVFIALAVLFIIIIITSGRRRVAS